MTDCCSHLNKLILVVELGHLSYSKKPFQASSFKKTNQTSIYHIRIFGTKMKYGLNDHYQGRQDYSDADDIFWMLVQNAYVKKCWTKTFHHQHFKLVTIGGSTTCMYPNIRYQQWCPISMTLSTCSDWPLVFRSIHFRKFFCTWLFPTKTCQFTF